MFDRVMLQREDRPRALTALGLRIKKRSFFNQPCTALCGVQCTIYAERPVRCRQFECRQFREVASGQIPESTARARIDEVRRQVAHLESLLAVSGGENVRKPLVQRHATALAEQARLGVARPDLVEAMARLESHLTRYFKNPEGA
jgi:hypothetical protein